MSMGGVLLGEGDVSGDGVPGPGPVGDAAARVPDDVVGAGGVGAAEQVDAVAGRAGDGVADDAEAGHVDREDAGVRPRAADDVVGDRADLDRDPQVLQPDAGGRGGPGDRVGGDDDLGGVVDQDAVGAGGVDHVPGHGDAVRVADVDALQGGGVAPDGVAGDRVALGADGPVHPGGADAAPDAGQVDGVAGDRHRLDGAPGRDRGLVGGVRPARVVGGRAVEDDGVAGDRDAVGGDGADAPPGVPGDDVAADRDVGDGLGDDAAPVVPEDDVPGDGGRAVPVGRRLVGAGLRKRLGVDADAPVLPGLERDAVVHDGRAVAPGDDAVAPVLAVDVGGVRGTQAGAQHVEQEVARDDVPAVLARVGIDRDAVDPTDDGVVHDPDVRGEDADARGVAERGGPVEQEVRVLEAEALDGAPGGADLQGVGGGHGGRADLDGPARAD